VNDLIFKNLGRREFTPVWAEMQRFTDERTKDTADEIWFVEHPSVFTLGLNADPMHIFGASSIPIVKTDRGGQVTYHGPGQQVVYVLLHLSRWNLTVRALVECLEEAIIETVALYGVAAYSRREAPGVYVGERKLGAIGLRVRRGCSYHGIAVNIDMSLEPFSLINPCGMADLEVTQLVDVGAEADMSRFREDFASSLRAALSLRRSLPRRS
jgi:lipoyl(octanoyl) transferase